MKANYFFSVLFSIFILAACQTGTTSPLPTTTLNNEITLAPDQSTKVAGTDLTITLHSVVSDERCPSDVECADSGPVTVSLSFQQGDDTPNDFVLQTFTDLNGRSPNVQFEGITNRAELGDYVLQITSVTPYPTSSTTQIEPSTYRVSLLISKK